MLAHVVQSELLPCNGKQATHSGHKLTVYVMHIEGEASRVCSLLVNNLCYVCMYSKTESLCRLSASWCVCKLAVEAYVGHCRSWPHIGPSNPQHGFPFPVTNSSECQATIPDKDRHNYEMCTHTSRSACGTGRKVVGWARRGRTEPKCSPTAICQPGDRIS